MGMSKKQEERIERLFGRLRERTVRRIPHPVAKTQVMEIDATEARVRALLSANEQIDRLDGYASRTPGNGSPGAGKGGSRQMLVHGDDPNPRLRVLADEIDDAWVRTTSTEATALTAVVDGARADEVDALARAVLAGLEVQAKAAENVKDALDRWDALRSNHKIADPPYCYVAQVVCGLPWDVLWKPEHETRFDGVLAQPLDEARGVSLPMYRFVRHHRRMPRREEAIAMLERGIVRVHAS